MREARAQRGGGCGGGRRRVLLLLRGEAELLLVQRGAEPLVVLLHLPAVWRGRAQQSHALVLQPRAAVEATILPHSQRAKRQACVPCEEGARERWGGEGRLRKERDGVCAEVGGCGAGGGRAGGCSPARGGAPGCAAWPAPAAPRSARGRGTARRRRRASGRPARPRRSAAAPPPAPTQGHRQQAGRLIHRGGAGRSRWRQLPRATEHISVRAVWRRARTSTCSSTTRCSSTDFCSDTSVMRANCTVSGAAGDAAPATQQRSARPDLREQASPQEHAGHAAHRVWAGRQQGGGTASARSAGRRVVGAGRTWSDSCCTSCSAAARLRSLPASCSASAAALASALPLPSRRPGTCA